MSVPEQLISVACASGVSFQVLCRGEKERWRATSFASKEPETIEWITASLGPGDVFWDVGANIGLYSLYAAALEPACQVYCFEPESQNYASLCQNLFTNRFENAAAFGVAVSGAGLSFVDLYVSEMESGSAIHNVGCASPWAERPSVFVQKALAVSVDELVNSFGLLAPTLLKLDVDGLEIEILRTAFASLPAVRSVLVELDANDAEEMSDASAILSGAGLKLVRWSNRTKTINGKLPRNFIWSR